MLVSRLKEKNVFQSGTNIIFYGRREKDLLSFFTEHNNLVFYKDIGNQKKIHQMSDVFSSTVQNVV